MATRGHAEGWQSEAVAAAVFALVPGAGGGRAVDLSCGTGRYTLALAERGVRVVGVDLSAPMLARARAERSGLAVGLVRADAGALPFRAGAFDLATMILGLEFVAEPGRPLQEAHRVLRPGGRLVVAILDRSGFWTLWRRLKRRFVPSIWRGARFLAVHFLPLLARGRAGWLEQWEAIGARWMPAWAAFVAVAARRV